MAVSLTGTGVQFANGSVQQQPGRIITYAYAENRTRQAISTQSGGSDYDLWYLTGVLARKRTDTAIRVRCFLPGVDAYSYPYYGTYVGIAAPDGTRYREYGGSSYHSNYQGNTSVYWTCDFVWYPANIQATAGNWSVFFGYGDSSSGGGNKPWETYWNPNNNDDSRAWQQGTQAHIEEILW